MNEIDVIVVSGLVLSFVVGFLWGREKGFEHCAQAFAAILAARARRVGKTMREMLEDVGITEDEGSAEG